MNSTEAAYAAGFFDGEGTIGIHAIITRGCRDSVYRLRLTVGQDDPRPLLWLAERWGGTVNPTKTPRVNRTHHRWYIGGPGAGTFLRDVIPYLIVKRAQAELAVTFQASRRNPGRRGLTDEYRAQCRDIQKQIQALNHLAGKHSDMASKHPDLAAADGG